jgi:hypothetical protein
MKMMNRPNTVTHFQSIGFCQRRREPVFASRTVSAQSSCRAQRRQRGGERTARAVGVFGLHARRGKTYFAVAGKEPVRAFSVIR